MKRFSSFRWLFIAFAVLFSLVAPSAVMAVPAAADPPAAVPVFSDVARDDKNLLFINYLANRQIVKGFPDGSFRPGSGLTRAEAAVLAARSVGLPEAAEPSRFTDMEGHWAAGAVSAAQAAGFVSGYPDGLFRPDDILTRAEGITLVLKLSRQPDPGVALPALEDFRGDHWAARPVAVGLSSGMVAPGPDNKNFLPL